MEVIDNDHSVRSSAPAEVEETPYRDLGWVYQHGTVRRNASADTIKVSDPDDPDDLDLGATYVDLLKSKVTLPCGIPLQGSEWSVSSTVGYEADPVQTGQTVQTPSPPVARVAPVPRVDTHSDVSSLLPQDDLEHLLDSDLDTGVEADVSSTGESYVTVETAEDNIPYIPPMDSYSRLVRSGGRPLYRDSTGRSYPNPPVRSYSSSGTEEGEIRDGYSTDGLEEGEIREDYSSDDSSALEPGEIRVGHLVFRGGPASPDPDVDGWPLDGQSTPSTTSEATFLDTAGNHAARAAILQDSSDTLSTAAPDCWSNLDRSVYLSYLSIFI